MKTLGEISHIPEGPGGRPRWVIKAEPQVMMRLKRFFPQVKVHRSAQITLTDTPKVARELQVLLELWPLAFENGAQARLRRRALEHTEREEVVAQILGGEEHVHPTGQWLAPPDHYEHRPEQLQAADLCLATGGLLLGDVLGKGKTYSALLVLRNPAALPALVVAPTHIADQWLAEMHEAFPMLRGHILRQGTPYDIAAKREMRGHDPDVIISTYHKLDGWREALAGKVRTVVFDQVEELRHHDSAKYKAAAHIADEAEYRIGLAGHPVHNYGEEAFNVVDVLRPGALGSREEFRREWGKDLGGGKMGVQHPDALGRHLREEGLYLRRGWESGDLNAKIIRHAIAADEDVYETESAGADELARLILKGTKKQRFEASGQIDWKLRQATGLAKAPFVADFTRMLLEEDEERRIILFGWHHAVYDVWAERLSDFDPTLYTGEQSNPQKRAAEKAFTTGDSRLLVMSLRSGVGLDGLEQVCNVAVFGELDWSPAKHKENMGRIDPRRQGEEKAKEKGAGPAIGYFLVSQTGTDPHMEQVLDIKRMQSEPIEDPDAALVEKVPDHSGHIRELAEEYLRRKGVGEAIAA